MLYTYLDSSGWVKRYYAEPGSDLTQLLFEKLLRPRPSRLLCLRLGIPEVISVLNRHRNSGKFTRSNFNAAYSYLFADSRLIRLSSVKNYQVDSSIPLLLKHNLNATDALHLQVAIELRAKLQQRGDDLFFFGADNRLIRAAQSEGFSTFNPEVNTVAQLEAMLP